ncbi:hypothetical protein BD626DRAFT_394810 [Schizophyllum amplum]|uniref:AAA+ ATPase domain-containing protein n=1 Tax=Schizophyllum amplum TaxID=97359 RepID=A0A550CV94_9AGAR|nr:hypothetical protein BD626DRAFT_394810 [Auriculariopsis ampla]
MAQPLRRSTRNRTASASAGASGSEYQEDGDADVDAVGEDDDEANSPPPTKTRGASRRTKPDPDDDADADAFQEPEPEIETYQSSRGRRVLRRKVVESSDGEAMDDAPQAAGDLFASDAHVARTRASKSRQDEGDDEGPSRRYQTRRAAPSRQMQDFIVSDEEDHEGGRYNMRARKQPARANGTAAKRPPARPNTAAGRAARAARRSQVRDHDYMDHPTSPGSADADGEMDIDDGPDDLHIDMVDQPDKDEDDEEDETNGRTYSLRQRQKINYAIPPPLEELPRPPPRNRDAFRSRGRPKAKGLGWSASGAELGRWMGMGGDDSDSDNPTRTPGKRFGAAAPAGSFGSAVAGTSGGYLPADLAAGTPSNFGKVGDAALADADPLGVNQNVTFDEVGGLDDHIHSLKEMTLLPLLYPEVFQQFKVTPPRGVLFHGPPGTGKTLLARALAASSRTGDRQITFYMRKGADILSKWVGEAERQLRLLFEEAKNTQPSIIFFDEIDGLAPVRSSKQDQIHASIVSTLLALLDGMDGRGQIVVIGATNRPDALDPALRRPGRFDREFYFPLPGLEAREKILRIMTKEWKGWDGEEGKERLTGLAKLTKGYGGADLRALCTEAALNAIQRKYPQIYKTKDRLLLKPDEIRVGLRDFMISIKKLVPSSQRSSASAAQPLPPQFTSLLGGALDQVKGAINRAMPLDKKLSALEEAEFEDYLGEDGDLEREMNMQSMQTLRVHRPRVIVYGLSGMGQRYLGAAALHHLEGYNVQSLELGTLMSDSTRTPEAAIVQLFVEAKRHQPSVIYIPSLEVWSAAISDTAKATMRAMLDTLSPTDPILLLGVMDGKWKSVPREVREWFGPAKDFRVELTHPGPEQREAFFTALLDDVRRPPNKFADGMQRKKRVLEELPIAPPLEPRKPTENELRMQVENDNRVIALLKYRLDPILIQLKRKFKRFTKRATDEYDFNAQIAPQPVQRIEQSVEIHQRENGVIEITQEREEVQAVANGMEGVEQPPAPPPLPKLYDIDLERMHTELYRGRYLTPQDFLDDVGRIVRNANSRQHEDLERLHKAQAMFTAAEVSCQEFEPSFRMECERMAARERQRRKEERRASKEREEREKPATPPRRTSARTNGLQPEVEITDPVQLERRLKRARNSAEIGAEEDDAEGEHGGKRARTGEESPDELNMLPAATSRPGVRFAGEGPMAPVPFHIQQSEQSYQQPQGYPLQSQPYEQPGFGQSSFPPQDQSYDQFGQQPYPQQNVYPQNAQYPDHHGGYPQQPHVQINSATPNGFVAEPVPQRSSQGFDPALLNPMPNYRPHPSLQPTSVLDPQLYQQPMYPQENQYGRMSASNFDQAPYPPQQGFRHPHDAYMHPSAHPSLSTTPVGVMNVDPADPFQSQPMPAMHSRHASAAPSPMAHAGPSMSRVSPMLHVPSPMHSGGPSPRPPVSERTPSIPREAPTTVASLVNGPTSRPGSVQNPEPREASKQPSPEAMVVERTPTPLPDFVIDEERVERLKDELRDRTDRLNVEQLDHLRAACLRVVWQHRTEWNRGALLDELDELLRSYLQDVLDDEDDYDGLG